MSNINHNFPKDESKFWIYCLKCKESWTELHNQARRKFGYTNFNNETNIEFVNRVLPCITDNEAAIKNILE